MAATLPALQPANSQLRMTVGGSDLKMPSKMPSTVSSSKDLMMREVTLMKRKTRRDQDLWERQMRLRAEVPYLSIRQTAEFRNTYKHCLCTEILEGGFHRSFAELFGLIRRQQMKRNHAGPESSLWNQKLLTDEPEKLDTMKNKLIEAETALLKKDYVQVYECHRFLAQYFHSFGFEHKWLADHFFQNCLQWSMTVTDDNGQIAADGHCNIGLSLEASGKLSEAASNFQLFYVLTKDKPDWMSRDGSTSMHSQACSHLARIYMALAEQKFYEGDSKTSLEYFSHAYEMAREGGNKQQLGEAGYCLGVAHERNKDSEQALLYLQSYLDTCRSLKDSEGIGKACDAIAKSYDSLGRVDESIRYLEMFIKVSEDNHDEEALSQACKSLGIRFNALGRYEQAATYFDKGYNIDRTGSDDSSINRARSLVGIAKAHSMLRDFGRHIETDGWPYTTRLIAWKDARTNNFNKPIPEPGVASAAQAVTVEVQDVGEHEEVVAEEGEGNELQEDAVAMETTATGPDADDNNASGAGGE